MFLLPRVAVPEEEGFALLDAGMRLRAEMVVAHMSRVVDDFSRASKDVVIATSHFADSLMSLAPAMRNAADAFSRVRRVPFIEWGTKGISTGIVTAHLNVTGI